MRLGLEMEGGGGLPKPGADIETEGRGGRLSIPGMEDNGEA